MGAGGAEEMMATRLTISKEENMLWDNRYRQLEMGEVVQAGDEIFRSDHPWHGGNERWEPVPPSQVGQIAPDPRYVSHRRFRRLIWA